MFYQTSKRFAFTASNSLCPSALKLAVALAIAMILPLVASAYTIVLRDGRHTEIPATFIVTGTTLTYERSPGFNVTLQLSIIDIPATERSNNEAPGSFLKRSERTPPLAAVHSTQARITITNANLERWRRARLESEKAYEQRRRALGLPSIEETRRRQDQEADETLEVIRPRIAVEEAREAYWRGRANELRGEVAAVEAQIYYLQSRLAEFSNSSIASVGPFIGWGNTRVFGPARGARGARGAGIGGYAASTTRPQMSGPLVFGQRGWGGQVLLNPARRTPFGYWDRFGGPVLVPFRSAYPFNSIGRPLQSYENSYERATIVQQLDELLGARAGFLARWRLLEEEARRAGAYPGWLRP